MAAKKAAPTDDELKRLIEGIGDESAPASAPSKGTTGEEAVPTPSEVELTLLAQLEDLEKLGADYPPARPHTPRVPAAGARPAPVKRSTTGTPPPPPASDRSSEDKPSAPRKSGDSARSFHTSFTPSATSSELQESEKSALVAEASGAPAAGGGWWGSVFATASAAVKQAEAAVSHIQQNEEAKKYLEHVKGNVVTLRGFGGELRSRALPTFTNILHTLAPPISSHERLQIHITHDLLNYPSLDPLIHSTFSRVMAQVEGGDLMVIQRGQESTARREHDGYTGGSSGWNSGPWWRQSNEHRDMGSVKGLVEGSKLVRVSAESYANEYFSSRGGLEAAAQRATEDLSESNPVRSSDIFLAVQAILHSTPAELFQGSAQMDGTSRVEEDDAVDEQLCFAIYLHDPVHSITFHTLTQSVPAKWVAWLDAASPTSEHGEKEHERGFGALPDEIREIIEAGGVDPREWAAEWVEECIGLGVGVVAQRYVARRMGVGEGGIGRGKARMEEVVDDGGGEAARAGII